jgi:hypothetical protein
VTLRRTFTCKEEEAEEAEDAAGGADTASVQAAVAYAPNAVIRWSTRRAYRATT